MSDSLNLDLDPRKVVDSLKQMAEEMKNLADTAESALGKGVKQPLEDLEDAAEKGTNKVAKYFQNLGKRIKDDLKAAFDLGSVLQGAKFANELMDGTKQVFEMERAFDRLNTRIGKSGAGLADFKKQLGQAVAGTGAQLRDILPGVESAAARGNIRDTGQLSEIGKSLGQARMTTGEDVTGLSDTITEIMKNQRMPMNAESFKSTLDAVQGTRVNGAFKTAGEAANSIEGLSPYGQQLGLNVRQLGGLSAQASQGGQGAQDILRQIMEKGSTIEGRALLNATVSGKGSPLFTGEKFNPENLAKMNGEKYKNDQILGEASGLSGANGQDLQRLIGAFKQGGGMDAVAKGANETANQYEQATDNLASAVDRFKEKSKEAGREIMGGLSTLAYGIGTGDLAKIKQGGKDTGSALWQNKGTVAADLGITAGISVLAGGGAKRLLGRLGGVGGAIGGIAGGEAAKAAGIQQVYVVNMGDGGGMGGGGLLGGLGGGAGMLAKVGKFAVGGAAVAGAGYLGYKAGEYAMDNNVLGVKTGTQKATDFLYDKFNGDRAANMGAINQNAVNTRNFNERNGTSLSPSEFAIAIRDGTLAGIKAAQAGRPKFQINPSAVTGRAVGG